MSKSPLQNTFALLAIFLHLTLFGVGCNTVKPLAKQRAKLQEKKVAKKTAKAVEAAKNRPAPQPVRLPMGTVHMVHPGGEFVLIQSARKFSPEPGSVINTYGPDGRETAKLEMSDASKGGFITADIVSGKPTRGDRAVSNYIPPGSTNTGSTGGSDIQVLE